MSRYGFIIASALAIGQGDAHARDTELLMLAAQLNYMNGVVPSCDRLLPGYAKKYAQLYSKAKANFFDPVGITSALMKEAEATAELASAPIRAKFERKAPESQRSTCEHNLSELKASAEANANTRGG